MLCEFPTYPTIPAADLSRARQFYEKTLGFDPDQVTPAGVLYRSKSSALFLYPSAFAGTNKATAAGFQVSNLPATVAELQGRGVRFEEYDMPDFKTVNGIAANPDGSKAAWFKDTEGNIIGLIETERPMI
jgi:catechol 2,3-dioxygenase-like lactoylglutathione lyase family enzyme